MFESKQLRKLAWEWHTDQMREDEGAKQRRRTEKKGNECDGIPHERSLTEHTVKSARIQGEGVVLLCNLRRTTMYFVEYLNARGGMSPWEGPSLGDASSFVSFHPSLLCICSALSARGCISSSSSLRVRWRSSPKTTFDLPSRSLR